MVSRQVYGPDYLNFQSLTTKFRDREVVFSGRANRAERQSSASGRSNEA